ncbi:hypothetical protein Tco_0455270 [Tanacetum coccineum]
MKITLSFATKHVLWLKDIDRKRESTSNNLSYHKLVWMASECSLPMLLTRLQIHQSSLGIFISQSKYALEILKKHAMEKCDSIGTLMATTPKLDADLSGTLINQTKYHSMLGSLMYLITSRLDVVYATCFCARCQARPMEKHLKEVKWIFRYLKRTINMGQLYLKDTGFELISFLDGDRAGFLDTGKSTSGGTQFLGDKLVSWSSKKQECTTMSTAEDKNPDLGTAVEYRRTSLASLDVSILDKPRFMLENWFACRDLEAAFEHPGGSPVGIHGLFSGRYCGLAGRKVTLRVPMSWANGITTGTLVRYETSCSRLSVICVVDWIGLDCIGLDCIGLVVHASLEYRDDKKDVRKSG